MSDEATTGTGQETASQASADTQTAQPEPQMDAAPDTGAENQESMDFAPEAEATSTSEPAPAEKPAEAPAEPLTVDMPEDVQVDEQTMQQFVAAATEAKLTKKQAQALMDLHISQQRQTAERMAKAVEEHRAQVNKAWAEACRNDPEVGGAQFEQSRNFVNAAIGRILPDPAERREFLEFYTAANLRNSPHMFKFLARVGRMTAEAGPALSDAQNAAKELTPADKLFPNLPSERL